MFPSYADAPNVSAMVQFANKHAALALASSTLRHWHSTSVSVHPLGGTVRSKHVN